MSVSFPAFPAAYITAAGSYLPGPRISNDEMEDYLGRIGGKPSRLRRRMLKQNGISGRHYAIDKTQRTTHQNVDLAANAVRATLAQGGLAAGDIDQLVAATSQGDLPLPGFGAMVHGELAGAACEVVTHHGVCASGLAAIKTAAQSVRSGEHARAVAVASELPSRLFKASRYEDQAEVQASGRLSTDAEFLRWMLSDGAGAVLVQDRPATCGLSLRVDWIRMKSHAHRYPTCMYVGGAARDHRAESWLDAPDYADAAERGLINLRQDLRLVDRVVALGVADYLALIEAGLIDPERVDHMLCHYSSRCFLEDIKARAMQAGAMIPEARWSKVMYERGNVGSASLYLMLDDLFARDALRLGQRVLCMVPESGRFTTGFMHLTAVDAASIAETPPERTQPRADVVSLSVARREKDQRALRETLMRQLMLTWHDFEARLEDVPFIDALYHGRATLPEYRALLCDLRQQVIQGATWIARAVSSIDAQHVGLRDAFLQHAGEEHLDYRMLEEDFVNCGGLLADIQDATPNPGSEALSAFLMHRATQPNPWDMLGAMFIIEGLGRNMASHWAALLKSVLHLDENQVRFLSYHGANDEAHTDKMYAAFEAIHLDEAMVARIVRTARMTARLYCLQLTEMRHDAA